MEIQPVPIKRGREKPESEREWRKEMHVWISRLADRIEALENARLEMNPKKKKRRCVYGTGKNR